LIGPVQPIQLPAQITGKFSDSGLTITSDGTSNKCSPVSSAVVSDLYNLLTRFPARLSRGLVWQDSVSTAVAKPGFLRSCTQPDRISFQESKLRGSAHSPGPNALDVIQANGEGAHSSIRLETSASGTGNVIIISHEGGPCSSSHRGRGIDPNNYDLEQDSPLQRKLEARTSGFCPSPQGAVA